MTALRYLFPVAVLVFLSAPARAEWKNVQVLPKNMPKEELKAFMKGISKQLGMECDACHDSPDMAADTKEEKKVAREMMKMTNEINAKWLKDVKAAEKNPVTCGTCHRGAEHPPKFTPAAK